MKLARWQRRLARKVHTALQMDSFQWFDLARAWWLILFIDLALRLAPFKSVQRFAAGSGPRPGIPADPAAIITRLQRSVDQAANHHLYPMTCLRRSLALQRLLLRHGIRAELRIGVRREEGALQAHAWLEYNGQALGERGEVSERFAALNAMEGAG